MKQILLILFCSTVSLVLRAQTGPWTQRNDFGFTSPNGPVAGSAGTAFGIGSVGFVTAQAVQASGDSLKNWFGQYDPATNTWTQKAVVHGVGGHIGFTVGGKGYVMSASNLWQYDPVTDIWTQLAAYPDASSTFPSTSFSIGSKGYVGGGRFFIGTGYTTIFYEYDPVTNVFTRKANLPDPLGQGGRSGDISFSIGNKGYWGTGENNQNFNSPTTYNDFYEYDPSTDTWTQKANVGGPARSAGVGFSIGNLGYVGTGAGQEDRSSGIPNYPFLKDFWQYDPSTDTWTQKADYGGGPVIDAAGFAILDKGYTGSGDTGACIQCGFKPSSDFWQYDPATDQWRQIAGFVKQEPTGIRFSVNGKGYIGPNSNSNNIWEYDTLGDSWSQKAAFPGALRSGITGFSIGDKAYAGTGVSASLGYYNDFWEFDPALNTWTAKANFGGGPRTSAMGFGIGSKGYMGTGTTDVNNRAAAKKDMWEYDPSTNTWTPKADFGGSPRYGSTTFTIGNMGYAALGFDTTNATFGKRHDLWQYDPATDTWTQKADFAGGNRNSPTGFGLLENGYIGMGIPDTSGNPQPDFWQYDPTADTWTRITDFPGGGRTVANSMAIGQKAYIGGGQDRNATALNDLWQFDPSGSTPLPLTLTGFTAVYSDPATLLHWATDQEQNTSLFTIQRSTDAKHFSSIGTVAAAGHTTSPKQYSFTDADAARTGVPELFYRLQEADLDGRLTLSPIVSVNINRLNKGIIVTPNPATDNITVQIGADAVTKAALVITDPAGRELVRQDLSLYTGNNSYPLAVASLPAGVYYIVVRSSAQSWQAKFIKK